MKLARKSTRRKRPIYANGTREDGAYIYHILPYRRSQGSHSCRCGRTISANKEWCFGCSGGAR